MRTLFSQMVGRFSSRFALFISDQRARTLILNNPIGSPYLVWINMIFVNDLFSSKVGYHNHQGLEYEHIL